MLSGAGCQRGWWGTMRELAGGPVAALLSEGGL